MKIIVGCIGKRWDKALKAIEDDFAKRLRKHCQFEVVEAKDEADLLSRLPKEVRLFLFDETGEQLSSVAFAEQIIAHQQLHGGGAPLAFLIGGADGHSEALKARCDKMIAFGRLTIAHRLVRPLVVEQLYRAFTILAGEPYHREG